MDNSFNCPEIENLSSENPHIKAPMAIGGSKCSPVFQF
jgi:hypothetical protein